MSPAVARIHYEIDDELHRRVKAAAAMRGITLKDAVTEALAKWVEAEDAARRKTSEGD